MDYIHYNPVKHEDVERVQDWPFSGFHKYVKDGIYPIDWCGGNVERFINKYSEQSGGQCPPYGADHYLTMQQEV